METYLDVPGARLFSRRLGDDRTKPWMVLSNSLATDHHLWDRQIEWLSATHKVLLYDTRGHGLSTFDGDIGFPALVADVVALMDHHGIGCADYIGVSLGGMVGLGLALDHPERLGRLVCSNARADAPEAVVKLWAERIRQVEANGLASLFPDTLQRWVGPAFQGDPDAMADASAMFHRTTEKGYVACAATLQTLDYLRHLPRMTLPVLFVAGSEDVAAPAADMREMAKATAGSSIEVIAGARHLSNIDMPAQFRAAVEPFLAGHR